MDTSASKFYGKKVRVRVCGICIETDTILLVNHNKLYGHDFWAPPGGGLEFGQSAALNLIREFEEETGLIIEVRDFLFACELIREPLHAIELFFDVSVVGGKLQRGMDPEATRATQVITDVKYMKWSEVKSLPQKHLHGAFGKANPIEKIGALTGYLKI